MRFVFEREREPSRTEYLTKYGYLVATGEQDSLPNNTDEKEFTEEISEAYIIEPRMSRLRRNKHILGATATSKYVREWGASALT